MSQKVTHGVGSLALQQATNSWVLLPAASGNPDRVATGAGGGQIVTGKGVGWAAAAC